MVPKRPSCDNESLEGALRINELAISKSLSRFQASASRRLLLDKMERVANVYARKRCRRSQKANKRIPLHPPLEQAQQELSPESRLESSVHGTSGAALSVGLSLSGRVLLTSQSDFNIKRQALFHE